MMRSLFCLTAGLLLSVPVLSSGTEDGAERLLRNDQLEVRVMVPDHPGRYNRGTRFTPVAAVLGVRRDGVEYLYRPDAHDPINDHAGLAAEFDLCIPDGPANVLPSGYQEAAVGEGFIKIGVGALRKPAKTYHLFMNPELLEPALTTVEWQASRAVFHQIFAGRTTPGYSYRLDAVLSLEGASVTVDWKLSNTGTRPITTRQYTHDFFRIAGRPTASGYILSFPYDIQPKGLEGGQNVAGRAVHFTGAIPRWINATVAYPASYAGPNIVALRHPEAGREIICETSDPGLRTDIHARADYISPEQFIEITLPPGGAHSWTRKYTFLED
ncbi:MAG: hypothetical protein J0I10_21845 [Verrucomicrobia bacterium]|nr:hypothetical protein [Verrucomicrobiota bacterium]